jgi:tripartite motif-containing protein 71
LGMSPTQKFSPNGLPLLAVPNPPQPPPAGGFAAPTDVGVDAIGNVFVTDVHNWRIEKFNADGAFVRQWGKRGSGPTGFNYPKGIDVDRRDGAVVVADTDNGHIKKYTNDGAHVWTYTGNPTSGRLAKSVGLEVGHDGRIYVSDFGDCVVEVLDPNGSFLYQFGGCGFAPGSLRQPRGIAIDRDGTLWIADRALGWIQHFSNDGRFLTKIGTPGTNPDQLSQAEGVAVDDSYVYVADAKAHQIKVWTKTGDFLGAFGSGGRQPGQMLQPHGLEIGPDGGLYVVEQNGERVQRFTLVRS